jgi:hypothetical protein
MKTERFAMAYRLLLRVRLISVRSLSKIAHIYRLIVTGVVGGASRASRRSRTYKGITLRKPPYHYASRPYAGLTARAHSPILMQKFGTHDVAARFASRVGSV